jgi:hypothetical protein
MQITGTNYSLALCIKCNECTHDNTSPKWDDIIWIDSDDTVYFTGLTVESLMGFLLHHDKENVVAVMNGGVPIP